MSRFQLTVGSDAFWRGAAADIAGARRRVLVQAMTFEGDGAGAALAQALLAARAPDRRLLIDAYSFHVVNDTMLPTLPWRARSVRDEARATRGLLDRLAGHGVAVAVTEPVGRNPLRFPLRNHKKLLVIDDVAWLGGINFSDHNFAWHDLMVRIDDAQVAEFLAGTFADDWHGTPRAIAGRFGTLDLLSLDGASNEATLAPVLDLFANAQRSIELVGAYPTRPFTDALATAAKRGCAVTIHTPSANNKPLLRDYLFDLARRCPALKLNLLPGMTHAKAALVDGETLLFGSVNFNVASWRSNGDLLAITRDAGLIAAFERDLFAPAQAAGQLADRPALSLWRRARARLTLAASDAVLARLSFGTGPRVSRWPAASAFPEPPLLRAAPGRAASVGTEPLADRPDAPWAAARRDRSDAGDDDRLVPEIGEPV